MPEKLIELSNHKHLKLGKLEKQEKEANELHNFEERVDDPLVWGTRSLTHFNQRYNVAVFERVEYAKAERDKKWIVAM